MIAANLWAKDYELVGGGWEGEGGAPPESLTSIKVIRGNQDGDTAILPCASPHTDLLLGNPTEGPWKDYQKQTSLETDNKFPASWKV